MAKKPEINPAAFLVKRTEQQEERRAEAAAPAPEGEAFAHLQVRLAYDDYEMVRRVVKRDLRTSIQTFLIEAISTRLQELGHAPIRDPGAGKRGRD